MNLFKRSARLEPVDWTAKTGQKTLFSIFGNLSKTEITFNSLTSFDPQDLGVRLREAGNERVGQGMDEIFGSPNKVIEYANPLTEYGRGRWGCGYWWKLHV